MHDTEDREHALMELQRTSGALTLRDHDKLGTVDALEFLAPVRITFSSSTSVSTAVRDFILRYRPLFGLGPADTLETLDTTTDRIGMRHISYSQKRFGVPVWGSQLDAHLYGVSSVSVDLVRLHGHLLPISTLWAATSQPTLSAEAARQRALATARHRMPRALLSASSSGLYYFFDDRRLNLVYRVEVYGQNSSLRLRAAYFIDAHDGRVHTVEDLVTLRDMTIPAPPGLAIRSAMLRACRVISCARMGVAAPGWRKERTRRYATDEQRSQPG